MNQSIIRPAALAMAVQAALLPAAAYAQQVIADGTQMQLPAGAYHSEGEVPAGSALLLARNGGTLGNLGAVTIGSTDASVSAAWADGAGSVIRLSDARINATGEQSHGLHATAGGGLELDNATVVKRGIGAAIAVENAGSTLRLSNSQVSTDGRDSAGVQLQDGGHADISNSRIDTTGAFAAGVNLNRETSSARLDKVAISTGGDDAPGVWLVRNGSFDAVDVSLHTRGARAIGADLRGGHSRLQRGSIHTGGVGAHGLVAQNSTVGSAAPAEVDVEGTQIQTAGDKALGAAVRGNARLALRGAQVRTRGADAHALQISGAGSQLQLTATDAQASGTGAHALQLGGGQVAIDGGSLRSSKAAVFGFAQAADVQVTGGTVLGDGSTALASLANGVSGASLHLGEGVQAHGDIVQGAPTPTPVTGMLDLTLDKGAHWQGRSSVLGQVQLRDNSTWSLTGDARVAGLDLRGSTLQFAAPTGAQFALLDVEGDYHGEQSVVSVNANLDGADAGADRLHIHGDSSGQTWMQVNLISPVTRPTEGDGVEVVTVDGRSDGEFLLQGRAVRGNAEYFLHKGGLHDPEGSDWYLRSALREGPTLDPDPTPEPGTEPGPDPDVIERPEPALYLANQLSALSMFDHRLQHRMGGRLPFPAYERRGAWSHVSLAQERYPVVARQLSMSSHRSAMLLGTDLAAGQNSRMGVMVGQGNARNTASSRLTGYRAEGKVNGSMLGVYATWHDPSEDQSGFQVDGWAQWRSFRQEVRGEALAPERTRGQGVAGSVELGYAMPFQIGADRTLYVEPQMQIMYSDYRTRAHVERNGTRVETRGAGGLSSRVGVRVYGRAGTPKPGLQRHAWVQPYVAVNWLNSSHRDDALRFDDQPWKAEIGQRRLEGAVGVQMQLGARLNGWGELSLQDGSSQLRSVQGQIGLRYNW